MTQPAFDDELLRVAEQTLQEMQFTTEPARIQDIPCLLAENELFILAVVSTADVVGLAEVDEAMSLHFASEVAAADVAEKQWDVYLVLLTSGHLPPDQSDMLYRLSYNTHYLRRLVRTDVVPTPAGLRSALRSFALMPEHTGTTDVGDALNDLEGALREHGVPPDTAQRAIASFRATGEVDDV